ncbi:hypothetical protein BC940DRAFT_297630 [Gongronella butleri]|nr:hypothetical protein BC940DRAFT_297630 [Gongronella butleri]
MASQDDSWTMRRILFKVYNVAHKTQAVSAVGFSTFALVHGLQVAAGAVGGAERADRLLLLTRPFYQDAHLEGVLVTGSVAVHVVAGAVKSTIQSIYQIDASKAKPSKYHGVTGQLLVPLVAAHYYLVRGMPLRTMGDSAFVDFGIVAWGLQNRPVLTYGLHLLLIGTAVHHMLRGAPVALTRTFRSAASLTAAPTKSTTQSSSNACRSRIPTCLIWTTGVVLVVGVWSISKIDKIPLRREYSAIYTSLFPW